MKRYSILLATLVAFGLAACGEQQKPAPKAPATPPSQPVKPEAAAPTPPPPPAADAAKPDAAAPIADHTKDKPGEMTNDPAKDGMKK